MKNWYTLSVLSSAFLLGAVATAFTSGCQKVPPPSAKDEAPTADAESDSGPALESPGNATVAENSLAVAEPASTADEPPSGQAAASETHEVSPVTRVLFKKGDWPQWGGDNAHNNTPEGKNIPIDWAVGEFDRRTQEWIPDNSKNIKWVARLGSQSYGNPVVANDRVYVGTNNKGGWLKRYPSDIDLGCLVCFNEADGTFLWQDSSEKLPIGRVNDWPLQGICCAPLVEGDRVWFVTSRGEVKCLDAEGFYDGEDDGPVQGQSGRLFDVMSSEDPAADQVAPMVAALDEGQLTEALRQQFADRGEPLPDEVEIAVGQAGRKWTLQASVEGISSDFRIAIAGPRLSVFKTMTVADKHESDVVWVFDMMSQMTEQQVFQHNMCSCSVTSLGDILFVNTSNGVDQSHENIPAPDAPSFLAMNKHTGEVYWTDKSPGVNILHGQWSSPTIIAGDVPQVVFAGGDGWVYSFVADTGQNGKPELLWKFDANPKESKWILSGRGTRNNIIATPVVYDGLLYVAVGQDPEHGDGNGHLWCLDPTKRGDVSAELAMKVEGDERNPIPHRRIQAVNPEDGEVAVDNPNSAVVWHFSEFDQDGDGTIAFEEAMHRSCGTVAIKNDLLFIADFSGLFHCLNAKDGTVHWSFDMLAAAWGSPLIVEDHVYIGDEDGDISIFKLSADPNVAMKEIEGERYPINAQVEDTDDFLIGDVTRMGNSVYSTPIVANNTLFIANRTHLFAIEQK